MKLALCLYGQPRCLYEGFEYLNNIIQAYDTDVFYHVWDTTNTQYPVSYSNPYTINKSLQDINCVKELYKPVEYEVEMSREFLNDRESVVFKNTGMHSNSSNLLSQMYSRTKVCNLFKNHYEKTGTKYTMVIFTRFDIMFNKLPSAIDLSKIYTIPNLYDTKFIMDKFFIMKPEYFIKIFGNLYESVNKYIANGCYPKNPFNFNIMYCPEQMITQKIVEDDLYNICMPHPDMKIEIIGFNNIKNSIKYDVYIASTVPTIIDLNLIMYSLREQSCKNLINSITILCLEHDNFEHYKPNISKFLSIHSNVKVELLSKDEYVNVNSILIINYISKNLDSTHNNLIKPLILNTNSSYNLNLILDYNKIISQNDADYLTLSVLDNLGDISIPQDSHSFYLPRSFYELVNKYPIDIFLQDFDETTRTYLVNNLNHFLTLYLRRYDNTVRIKSITDSTKIDLLDLYKIN